MRSIAPHDFLEAIEWQGMNYVTISARHGLCHAEGIEDRLLGGLGGGLEDLGHSIGIDHLDVSDLVVLADMIGCREGNEDVTATVGSKAPDPGKTGCGSACKALTLDRKEGRIGGENNDDRAALLNEFRALPAGSECGHDFRADLPPDWHAIYPQQVAPSIVRLH